MLMITIIGCSLRELPKLLALDDYFGFNPGLQGIQKLWQDNNLALVHGCGYDDPTFSHFNAMAYWHTGAPHQGNEYGWLGRVADQMVGQRRDDMLINIGSSQSLAVKSAVHTPLVFDDPTRFQRRDLCQYIRRPQHQPSSQVIATFCSLLMPVLLFARIREAWSNYQAQADYGVAPMDLPGCRMHQRWFVDPAYHVAVRNNAFDTHVQQAALHQRHSATFPTPFTPLYKISKLWERISESCNAALRIWSSAEGECELGHRPWHC